MKYFEMDILNMDGEKEKKFNKLIGRGLKNLRESRRISQLEMSEKLKLSKNQLSAIERGVYKASILMIFQYCLICDATVYEALGFSFQEEKKERSDERSYYNIYNEATGTTVEVEALPAENKGHTDALEFYSKVLSLPEDERKMMLQLLTNK